MSEDKNNQVDPAPLFTQCPGCGWKLATNHRGFTCVNPSCSCNNRVIDDAAGD
jgi:hypothetical protein